MQFIPLHVYSTYSILQSGLSLKDYVKASKSRALSYVGISDLNTFYSFPHFYQATKNTKLTALYGVTLTFSYGTFVVYIKNETGYYNLLALLELEREEKVTPEDFKRLTEHLIFISSSSTLKDFTDDELRDYLKAISVVTTSFYIGLENESETVKTRLRDFAAKFNYAVVAFPLIKYINPSDRLNYEIANAVLHTETLTQKSFTGVHYFLTLDEVKSLYATEEIENTVNIAASTSFSFAALNKKQSLPSPIEGDTSVILSDLTHAALKARGLNNEEYNERLNEELSVINELGFNNYFLVVSDYVKFAKENDILVGYGRGSAAGSLVSYLLEITNIDPLKHHLFFERFLNKERVSMPDIDLDFEDYRRDEILTYLQSKYGRDHVANIVTFQVNAARASLRDAARVFSYDKKYIEALIGTLGNSNYSLRDSYRRIKNFKALLSDAHLLEIVSNASKIEGYPRQTSIHAAGVILSNEPLPLKLPVTKQENSYVTQYEMQELERQNFLKLDILGLTNLTTIHNIMNKIAKSTGKLYDFYTIPFDTPKTYEIIRNNLTSAIFQLESAGMNKAIAELEPENFNDISALLALYRPGPVKYISTYAKRKKGEEKVTYPAPEIADILKDTYGIIIYQEQIMQIAQKMAGFSLADADLFRRAISAKDEKTFASLEKKFKSGAIKLGHSDLTINRVFSDLVKFADYGFNKAHSVSYATITLILAYFKAHYPFAFYEEIMTNVTNDLSKYQLIRRELKELGINLLAPSVTKSNITFTKEDNNLRLPFTAIKGISRLTAKKLVKLRETNTFTSRASFFFHATRNDINTNEITALIESGALDEFGVSRQTLKAEFREMNEFLYSALFDEQYFESIVYEDIPAEEMLNFTLEIARLGFALTENPLSKALHGDTTLSTIGTIPQQENNTVNLVVFIDDVKEITTKKGDLMAFVTLTDFSDTIESVVFPVLYTEAKSLLLPGTIVKVNARTQIRNNKLNLIINNLTRWEDET
ncbi:MAG TPA: DNA polymerase III subunit alpha [Bacilli bacterium]|nr:DNA polymerase III subunit alpha [Bacilli bacterium]